MEHPRTVAAIFVGLVLLLAATALRHAPADEEALAKRLLLMRGHIDDPKIVSWRDGVLHVVTASGHFEYVLQPSCDEGLPCMLGFSMLCWDAVD
jgi:hypothetical protein